MMYPRWLDLQIRRGTLSESALQFLVEQVYSGVWVFAEQLRKCQGSEELLTFLAA